MNKILLRLWALFVLLMLILPLDGGKSPIGLWGPVFSGIAYGSPDDVSRLYNFTPGTTIQSSQVNGEFNQIISTLNNKFGRGVANTLTGNNIFSGDNTFSGITTFSHASSPVKTDKILEYSSGVGVTIDSVLLKDGFIRVPAGAGFTPATNGDLGYDSTSHTYDVYVNGAAKYLIHSGNFSAQEVPLGYRYHGSAAPVYASAATFSVAHIAERNSDNDGNIVKSSGSTTVDIATAGLNGVAQSAALSGSVDQIPALTITSVNSSTETITTATHGLVSGQAISWAGTVPNGVSASTKYFACAASATTIKLYTSSANAITCGGSGLVDITNTTTGATTEATKIYGTSTTLDVDYSAGDVICITGGQCRRVVSITSATLLVVESAPTTGLLQAAIKRGGEAPSTHYYLYAITDATTPGLILSTRNVAAGETLIDLPSGYADSRQLAFSVRNDSSGNLLKWSVGAGWPYRPVIQYVAIFTRVTASAPTYSVSSTHNVLNNGQQTSFADVDISALVPRISREIHLLGNHTSDASSAWDLRANGDTTETRQISFYGKVHNMYMTLGTDASQVIDYQKVFGTDGLYLDVTGYTVTEVP